MTRRTLLLPTLCLPTLLLPTLFPPTVFAEEPRSETLVALATPASPVVAGADRVTLDYRDADLSNVLRSLSYTYHLNLVTSSDVKGKVTVNLKDVTVDEALDAILTANGLTHFRKGNLIYINAGSPDVAAMASEPVPLKYLKAVDAQNLLRKVLSPKGDVKVDEVSNTLVITDFPGNIARVKQLLVELDLPPQQVLIEAKIVDITSKDLQNLGVTWTADWKPAGDLKGLFHRSGSFQEELKVTQTLAGSSSSVSGGQFKLDTLTLKGLTITATLDALIQDQKAHLLASPSIAVLNNQEARIVIGEKVPFKERTQTTTGTTETTKFIDVGTTLRVTPSINADGYITMRIHPEVSSVSALLDAGPRITTREADTTVRIKEGETIVIAGLIKQEDNRTKSRIPILGQLPVLDLVFGSRSKDQTQTELAVFITPKILRSREEAKTYAAQQAKKAREAEAHVTLPTTGELGLVLTLFQKAEQLEAGWGLESRRKPGWFRLQQAINLYEHIAVEFPDNPQAPEALFRAAKLQRLFFRNRERAQANLQRLVDRYPDSVWALRARASLEEIAQQEAQAQRAQRRHTERLQKVSRDLASQIAAQKRSSVTAERRQTERERVRQRRAEELQSARDAAAAEREAARRHKTPQTVETKPQQVQVLDQERQKAREQAEQSKAQRVKQQTEQEQARQRQLEERQKAKERAAAEREAARLQRIKAKEQEAALRKAEQQRRRTEQEQQRQHQLQEHQQAKERAAAKQEAARQQADEAKHQRAKQQQEAATRQQTQQERRRAEQEAALQRQLQERQKAQERATATRAQRVQQEQEAAERRRAEQAAAAQRRAEELQKARAQAEAERLERLKAQEQAAARREAQLEQERQRRAEERRKVQERAEQEREAARRRADAERIARLRRQVEDAERRLHTVQREQAQREAERLERLKLQLEEAEQAAAAE